MATSYRGIILTKEKTPKIAKKNRVLLEKNENIKIERI
jgi:hypothetical protein